MVVELESGPTRNGMPGVDPLPLSGANADWGSSAAAAFLTCASVTPGFRGIVASMWNCDPSSVNVNCVQPDLGEPDTLYLYSVPVTVTELDLADAAVADGATAVPTAPSPMT